MDHTKEELETMRRYEEAVDQDILNFVNDVLAGRDVLPITVGFVTEKAAEKIEKLTHLYVLGNRIVLDENAVKHIIRRHGPNGVQDHSMEDIRNIARLGYVLANHETIEFDNRYSKNLLNRDSTPCPEILISKRIDGTVYIVEAICDTKKRRNYVVSAYISTNKKATD